MSRISKIFLTLCLIIIFVPTKTVFSQSNIGPGVDLVILIDQSNSMFGLGATEERGAITGTDRDGRRIDSAQYLMDYMAFDNLHVNPNRINRVLVIAFGSRGREKVVVPLTKLSSQQDVQKAKNLVAPLRSPTESLNGTDFISAFEEIPKQFSTVAEDADLSNKLRRRLVVVITDGGPDIRGTRFNAQADYFEYLGEVYQNQLGEQYPVYVIGIDQNEPPLYWEDVVNLWESEVSGKGNAMRVTDPDEINKQVVKMFCPFLNPQGTGDECRLQDIGDHLVLPYARHASFSFFKYDPEAKIDLYRPTLTGETGGDKVQVEPQDPDLIEYNKTPSDEFFGLEDPLPGCWRSEREGAGKVDVLLQIAFNNMLMTQPSSAHPSVSPLNFEFSLKDAQGEPIDELGNFPINIDAEVTGPDGSSQSLTIKKEQPGLYLSQQPALTPVTGTYKLNLAGTTTIPALNDCLSSAGEYSIFSQTFQVPVYKPNTIIGHPDKPYLPYAPLEDMMVQFVDRNGNSINLDPRLAPDLVLTTPTGKKRPLENSKILSDSIQVESPLTLPEPGIYTVTANLKSPDGNHVYKGMTEIESKSNIEVIWPTQDYPAFAPLRFVEIELQDESGQSVSADPTYPLQIEASMTWPDGYSDTVALKPTSEKGHYRISASWPLTNVADHKLEIEGYTSLSPGSPPERIFIAQRTIKVSGNLPYYKISQPDEQKASHIYPLHHWFLPPLPFDFTLKPQPIEVELRYGNRLAQAQDFFVGDFNDLFHLKIVDDDDKILVEDHNLSYDGKHLFSTELHQLDEPGNFTATISLDGQLRGRTNAQGIWPSVKVDFERRDPVMYFVSWAIIGVVLLGALVYFGGGWVLNRFFLPKAKGKLVAVPGALNAKSSLWEFNITRQHKHHFTIKGQRIDARLQLSKIEVQRAMPKAHRRDKKKSKEGIKITAYDEEGTIVAEGSIYESRKLPVRKQRTSENQSYKFKYEA